MLLFLDVVVVVVDVVDEHDDNIIRRGG